MTTYYAVNTETKQHIKIPSMRHKPQGEEWKVVEGDDEGWIKFEGVDNPLPYNVKCRVGAEDDWRSTNKFCSPDWDWFGVSEYLPLEIDSLEEQQEWNGGGLPPVGTVCECAHDGIDQGVITVKYMGDEMCVLWNHERNMEFCGPIKEYTFVPVRTPAQRAEDATVEAMASHFCDDDGVETMRRVYAAIRDEKIPGVKLDL